MYILSLDVHKTVITKTDIVNVENKLMSWYLNDFSIIFAVIAVSSGLTLHHMNGS